MGLLEEHRLNRKQAISYIKDAMGLSLGLGIGFGLVFTTVLPWPTPVIVGLFMFLFGNLILSDYIWSAISVLREDSYSRLDVFRELRPTQEIYDEIDQFVKGVDKVENPSPAPELFSSKIR